MSKKAAIKNDSSGENEWISFFAITKHWQSDLGFFTDEFRFLRSLIDKYFLQLVKPENIVTTKAIADKLTKLDKKRSSIEQMLNDHLNHLTNLVEGREPQNAQECRDEHAALETLMTDFTKDLRSLKQEIFRLAEQIMESERANHLLGN
jgi:hypothetical protein